MKSYAYLDHAASSFLHPEVQKKYFELLSLNLGNAASIHQSGVKANIELEKARATIAQRLNANDEQIIFTSGATEANNLAIIGTALKHAHSNKKTILISNYEHSCVLRACEYLENTHQFKIKKIKTSKDGRVDLEDLAFIINETDDILLASIMQVNNELGSINHLKEISLLLKNKNILFHSDGAQGFCKVELNVEDIDIDFYSMSGHKIHAPKGIGALYVKDLKNLMPIIHGGNQEFAMRSGTVAFELAQAMSHASTLFTPEAIKKTQEIKNYLAAELNKYFSHILKFNTDLNNSTYSIINLQLSTIEAKTLLHSLSKHHIYVSAGSACNAGKTAPSRVLKAIGLEDKEALSSIRIGLGLMTEKKEIDYLIFVLRQILI